MLVVINQVSNSLTRNIRREIENKMVKLVAKPRYKSEVLYCQILFVIRDEILCPPIENRLMGFLNSQPQDMMAPMGFKIQTVSWRLILCVMAQGNYCTVFRFTQYRMWDWPYH